jgi:hypothetical protein
MPVKLHRPNITIRSWLNRTTPQQHESLARHAETSVPHLRHIGAGRRQMSADLAQRLATASRKLSDLSLELHQQDLCHACKTCPLVNGQ